VVRRSWPELAATALAVGIPAAASASGTISYNYDSKGWLVEVVRSGAAGTSNTTYTHDKADNRTRVTVAASPNTRPP
jgi:YD repeat-containing protein